MIFFFSLGLPFQLDCSQCLLPRNKSKSQVPHTFINLQTYLPHQLTIPKLPISFLVRFQFSTHKQHTTSIFIKTMRRTSSKAKKQSKLMYIICAPIRTLTKARNFYMRGLEDYAGKVGYGGGVSGYTASQVPHLPKSFSVNSSSSSDNEDLRQLLRTASSRKSNAEKESTVKSEGNSDMHRRPIVKQAAQPIGRQQTMNGMGIRSYSVGMKMGRIDEEMACSFEEDEVNVKADFYPRSRSYAVKRRSGGFA
ncbi:uncharacterized protein LOC18767587 [Prunus persica]|nr:uncharacterized protein LOC18767587 [Prunus persica]